MDANKGGSSWGFKINPKSLNQLVAEAQKEKAYAIKEAIKKGYELINQAPKEGKELEKRLKAELQTKMASYEKRKAKC